MDCEPTSVKARKLTALLLALLTIAVYWPVFSFPFIALDDPTYIFENPAVKHGLTARGIGWALSTTHAANWHPVTWLSHMIDISLFGMSAGPHHVVNVLFHVGNTVLLFFFLFRWTGKPWRSATVAALFAVHPLHVESVAWIAERKDVLSTFLMLLAMNAYCRQASKDGPKSFTGTLALFALGLMAKPMLVTLPFLLLLLDFWPLGRLRAGAETTEPGDAAGKIPPASIGTLLKEKIPFFLLSALSAAVTIYAQKMGGAMSVSGDTSMGDRVSNALTSYVAYIGKTLYPSDLAVLYPFDALEFPLWKTLLCAAALLAVSLVAAREWRRRPWLPGNFRRAFRRSARRWRLSQSRSSWHPAP